MFWNQLSNMHAEKKNQKLAKSKPVCKLALYSFVLSTIHRGRVKSGEEKRKVNSILKPAYHALNQKAVGDVPGGEFGDICFRTGVFVM
ncbi:hypothetical protein X975_19158, partial [Stegodyphus mimosarum]